MCTHRRLDLQVKALPSGVCKAKVLNKDLRTNRLALCFAQQFDGVCFEPFAGEPELFNVPFLLQSKESIERQRRERRSKMKKQTKKKKKS